MTSSRFLYQFLSEPAGKLTLPLHYWSNREPSVRLRCQRSIRSAALSPRNASASAIAGASTLSSPARPALLRTQIGAGRSRGRGVELGPARGGNAEVHPCLMALVTDDDLGEHMCALRVARESRRREPRRHHLAQLAARPGAAHRPRAGGHGRTDAGAVVGCGSSLTQLYSRTFDSWTAANATSLILQGFFAF